jgi:hypothetical protein
VRGLVVLDGRQHLRDHRAGREAGSGKVRILEFRNCLLVEFVLELVQDLGELCALVRVDSSSTAGAGDSRKTRASVADAGWLGAFWRLRMGRAETRKGAMRARRVK